MQIINIIQLLTMVLGISSLNALESDPVLKIGDSIFTEYELTDRYLQRYAVNAPEDRGVDYYIDYFIKKACVTHDLYMEKRHKNADVEELMSVMVHQVINQNNGYIQKELYSKIESDIEKNMHTIAEKRRHEVHIEVISIPYIAASSRMEDIDSNETRTFDDIKLEYRNNTSAQIYENIVVWPFRIYYPAKETMYRLQAGDTIGPLFTAESIDYIRCMECSVSDKPVSLTDEKTDMIRWDFSTGVFDGYKASLLEQAKPRINLTLAKQFLECLHQRQLRYNIDLSNLGDIKDSCIMTYQSPVGVVSISIADFADHYNKQLMRYWLDDLGKIQMCLCNIIFDQYMLIDAVDMGITGSTEYRLYMQNLRRSFTHELFVRGLVDSCTVPEKEMLDYYNDNMTSFIDGTEAHVVQTSSDSFIDACYAGDRVSALGMEGFKRRFPDVVFEETTIEYSSADPDSFITTVFDMPDNTIKHPIAHDGKFYVILKLSESGHRQQSLEEVKDKIDLILRQQKTEQYLDELYESLVEEYPIENNIDIDKCREYLQSLKSTEQVQSVTTE